MRNFEFFVNDLRYSLPTLLLVEARDETRARILAGLVLAESRHHLSVEVREGDRVLFSVGGAANSPVGAARA